MKLRALICFVVAASLSGCHKISNWMHKQDMKSEENFAAQEVVEPAHPVGASYDISSTDSARKQLSLFFNGAGLARLLETGIGREQKTLVDFKKHLIIHKDFEHNWQSNEALDPYTFPSVLTAKDAQQQKALCLGTGALRGFPYHRWGLRNNNNEWEVWTDDKDNFPIYYRTIKNGNVCTWTLVSSWVDGSTYDRGTFFSLDPDPPPPPPAPSEAGDEAEKVEAEDEQKHEKKPAYKHRSKHSTAPHRQARGS